jgi:hypothetical protein
VNLLNRIVNAAGAVAGVSVDGRRLSVSDAAFCGAVRRLARALAPKLELDLEPAAGGYRVQMKSGETPLSAVLVLEAIRFERGVLRLELGTPEGVSLDSRPVVGAFAAVVGSLFGGTWAGGKLLSMGLPETLKWDGKRATLDVPIDQAPVVGRRLAAIEAVATPRRENGTMQLELDRDGVAQAVLGAVLAGALDHVGLGGGRRG